MKVQHVIGADISKQTIDLVYHATANYIQIHNEPSGFRQLVKWLKQQKVDMSQTMLVMEHTGFYSSRFEKFLHHQTIAFTKISPLAIKRSLGLVRGKSDKVDAGRIAAYGYEKKEKLIVETPLTEQMQRLQKLHSTRLRLVRQRTALKCAIKEYLHSGVNKTDVLIISQMQMIEALNKQIKKLEAEIKAVVAEEQAVQHNFALLQTIKSVGKEIALATIIKTDNFTRFATSRKFACFCGTAPFEHTSGSTIRGRTKISHFADKHMKSLLDRGATNAIQYDQELRAFYLRRLQIGKSKRSTINIIRNKLIYRMFAVVKRQTPFLENYLAG
jgi:transposase